MNSQPTCISCRFGFCQYKNEDVIVYCRRYPTEVKSAHDYWCGMYEKRPVEPEFSSEQGETSLDEIRGCLVHVNEMTGWKCALVLYADNSGYIVETVERVPFIRWNNTRKENKACSFEFEFWKWVEEEKEASNA